MSQALAPVRATARPPASLRRVFAAAARSEWIKLRTVRSTIWALVLTVVFTIGLGALFTAIEVSRWDTRTLTEVKGFDPLLYSFAGLNLAQLSVGVLGVRAQGRPPRPPGGRRRQVRRPGLPGRRMAAGR